MSAIGGPCWAKTTPIPPFNALVSMTKISKTKLESDAGESIDFELSNTKLMVLEYVDSQG